MAEQLKRGDSLSYIATLPEADFPDGFFQFWTPSAQIRTAQYFNLIADLEFAWLDPTTTRSFTLTKTDTTSWPVGMAALDVQFVRPDGFTRSTTTLQVNIIHDITYPNPGV